MYQVDLNADLGESFGAYRIGCDEEVIQQVTSANISCGWHAGDPLVLDRTIALAKKYHVGVGAHPGFPDLLGFGRREIKVTPEEAYTYVLYQLGAFAAFARRHAVEVIHLKAHGALYNMAGKDPALAQAVCKAVRDFDREIILVGLAGSCFAAAAQGLGLRFANEVFADRAYEEDGSLVNRRKPGAIIGDESLAIQRVIRMVTEGLVTTITGKDIPVKADTICVHGDGPKALAFTSRIREALTAHHVELVSVSSVLG